MNGYGYQDSTSMSPMKWGLNQNVYLADFAFNPNGGKDGAEQPVLDITFQFPGGVKSYRQFPVERAFDKDGNEITDPNHEVMRKARGAFSKKISQIMECFVDKQVLKTASAKITSFKSLCEVFARELPTDYSSISLDVFCQWQWQVKEGQDKKFLEIPSKVNMGIVFCPHIEGNWEELKINPETLIATFRGEELDMEDNDKKLSITIEGHEIVCSKKKGLLYVDVSGDELQIHPIQRSDWFMDSPWSKEKNDEAEEDNAGW